MRNLLIISDTHKDTALIEELLKKYEGYTVFHCGDFCVDEEILKKNNITYVFGNCDHKGDIYDIILEMDSKKIFITHGHKYNVKFGLEKIYFKALELGCDYVFFGHTHQPLNIECNGIHFINPGSLKYGRTYALIENDNIEIKEI